jgi:tol-pal system protein YbgF
MTVMPMGRDDCVARRSRTAWTAVALALWATSAGAGLFEDTDARKKILEQQQEIRELQARNGALMERVQKLEEQAQQKPQGLLDLYAQLERLNAELAKLRGRIEEVAYAVDQNAKRQRDFYVDLDNRLRRLEQPTPVGAAGALPGAATPTGEPAVGPGTNPAAPALPPAAGAPASTAASPAPLDPVAEQRAYESAFNLFRQANYPAAIAAFNNFAKTYPQSPLAPSALYWVGNAYYAMGDFKNAIAAEQRMIAAYPTAQKVPDALLVIASSQQELKDTAAAKKTLEELVQKYPLTEAAEKAKRRLASLR